MFKTLMERLSFFALAGAAVWLLHYDGGLRLEAAWLIGGGFAFTALSLYFINELAGFEPYRLTIGIGYDALREDLRLPSVDQPKFENVKFHALSASVYARSDERLYSTKLDLFKEIPCGPSFWPSEPGASSLQPSFFLRPGRSGYRFGVQVTQTWWIAQKAHLPVSVGALTLSYDNTIELGCLPYGYIPEHIRRWDKPISALYGFDWRQRRWKTKLQRHGWTIDDTFPEHITHRYLGVNFSRI